MWKSVSFYLCVAAKVKCQEKHQDKRQAKSKKSNKPVVTLELFCLLNQPLLFPLWSVLRQAVMRRPGVPLHRAPLGLESTNTPPSRLSLIC